MLLTSILKADTVASDTLTRPPTSVVSISLQVVGLNLKLELYTNQSFPKYFSVENICISDLHRGCCFFSVYQIVTVMYGCVGTSVLFLLKRNHLYSDQLKSVVKTDHHIVLRYILQLHEKCEYCSSCLSGCVLYTGGTVSQPMDEPDVMSSAEVDKSKDGMDPGPRSGMY